MVKKADAMRRDPLWALAAKYFEEEFAGWLVPAEREERETLKWYRTLKRLAKNNKSRTRKKQKAA